MARPTIDLPYWAVQDVTLAVAGTTNKIEPKTSLQQYGWDKKEQPSCQELNWYFNAVYQWIAYLDTVSNSATSEATANTVVLRDSAAGFKAGAIQATSLTITSLKNTGSTTTYGAIINYGTITNSARETHTGENIFSGPLTSSGINTFSGVNTFNNTSNVFYGSFRGSLTGNVIGNAATATKLKDTFSLVFTGAATGSANIDGSTDITIDLVSSDNWTHSLASTGYSYLPNGMMVQWGITSSNGDDSALAVVFPQTFTTKCVSVTSSPICNQTVTGANALSSHVGNVSVTGFTSYVSCYSSSSLSISGVYWFAVGY